MQEIRVTFWIRDVRCAPQPIGERSAFATDLSKTRRVSFKLVAKPKTRRVSLHVEWQSPKPGGFHSMSSGKAQNPAGFAPCRVAEPKTRRVLLHVEWQSPNPGGFHSMSSGKAQNPAGFAPCRVAKPKTRRVSLHVKWQSPKPGGFRSMSSGRAQNPAGFAPCRVAESKTRRVSRCTVRQSSKLTEDGTPHVRPNASLTSKKHSSALPL